MTDTKTSDVVPIIPTANNLRLFHWLEWPVKQTPSLLMGPVDKYSVTLPDGWTSEIVDGVFVVTESKHRLQLQLINDEFLLACPPVFETLRISNMEHTKYGVNSLSTSMPSGNSHFSFSKGCVAIPVELGFIILNAKDECVSRVSQGSLFASADDVYNRVCLRLGSNLNPIRVRNLTEYLGCQIFNNNKHMLLPLDILEFTKKTIHDIVSATTFIQEAPKVKEKPSEARSSNECVHVDVSPFARRVSNETLLRSINLLRDDIKSLRSVITNR